MGYFEQLQQLNWRQQSGAPAPLDVPVLAMAPSGHVSVHHGRELLAWTRWVLVSEVAEFFDHSPQPVASIR